MHTKSNCLTHTQPFDALINIVGCIIALSSSSSKCPDFALVCFGLLWFALVCFGLLLFGSTSCCRSTISSQGPEVYNMDAMKIKNESTGSRERSNDHLKYKNWCNPEPPYYPSHVYCILLIFHWKLYVVIHKVSHIIYVESE